MTVATILPTARTVFLDTNDNPLSGGSVYFYIPNTTTLKTTWQDATGAVSNANPVVLDGNGSALIYGSGAYTQAVYNSLGSLIYTGLTQDVAGLILNGSNTFTGNNTFSGTNTFSGGFVLPNNYVTNAMLFNMAANTVKVNATSSLAAPTDLALALNKLLGRGSSGDIAAITLGTGLSFSGATLNGSAGIVLSKQVFTTSATYTPTSGMRYCIAEVVGGGGGGGGTNAVSDLGVGGGAGAYARSWISAATIGASQAVTIGAAGAGGSNTGGNGGTGGTSSLGALVICAGGVGGLGGIPFAAKPGSLGGTSSAGDLKIQGNASPSAYLGLSGAGANSMFGAGGISVFTARGVTATGNGAGGSGSYDYGALNPAGGLGSKGIVIITEFA